MNETKVKKEYIERVQFFIFEFQIIIINLVIRVYFVIIFYLVVILDFIQLRFFFLLLQNGLAY